MLDLLRRSGERCSDLSEEYIPDPYVIAIVLTFVASGAALATGSGPGETLRAWTGGVWSLLPFMAAISVLLMAGDAIAKSPTFTRGLERLARLPNSRFTAVWFTSFVAMTAAVVSWAIGLIVGAIMAKRVAYECREKGIAVHYPLLAAAGYTSLMVFHGGLSSSVGLLMADPSLIPATFPEYARVGIPLAGTIGSPANIVTTGTLLAVVPVVMGLLHPEDGVRELPRRTYREIDAVVTESRGGDPATDGGEDSRSIADRLNDSRAIGLSVALFPAYFVVDAWVIRPGGIANLTLNSINALFLLLAIALWTRPTAIVAQMKDSVTNVSGIIFQFPFYAGIAGLLTGTGLATLIVEFFGAFATPATWPVVGVLVAGVVNVFIPSGGGQWVAMGPIMLDITTGFGYEPEQAVVIEMLGDQLTNMIQPFWAIPLLAIADLRARDIIGYTAVAMVAGFVVVCGWLTLFFVVL
ncbi:TIGR00366 family protein [Halosimplex pelagicum]|uniref:Short-chain fatty acid transporter n=1 Tax=Halosimplex pelagicum TaxID=869886 RepID=A0A7D5PA12_9EURY|nr:TIGR00366 family protein [Halosimplex pelagicum]QLH83061.1 short-chain fatty acid transporter [Halosimplex pelagicum]